MTESKKGHNFAIQGPTVKKNTCSLIFCTDAIYKISSSWLKRFSSFTTNKRRNGQTDGRTDGRTDGQTVRRTDGQAQTNMPPQLLRSWGHNKKKNRKQGIKKNTGGGGDGS